MSSMNFNFEVKIKSAYEALSQAVNLFQIYLNDKTPASGTEYYRAKSLLREGKLFFEEALKEAKSWLDPCRHIPLQNMNAGGRKQLKTLS